jgi:hypothetical protein
MASKICTAASGPAPVKEQKSAIVALEGAVAEAVGADEPGVREEEVVEEEGRGGR